MSAVNFIFLHGRGGSGKDTQAELLAEKYPNSMRLSTGDIYRSAKENSGEYAQFFTQVEPYIDYVDSGHFLPDNVMLRIVNDVIAQKTAEGVNRFIFTGFPRTNEQLNAVDEWTRSLEEENQDIQIHNICYAVLEKHARARSEKRRNNYEDRQISIRIDDQPVAVENKLKNYRELTLPMLRRLSSESRLSVIKASGSIDDVFRRTLEAIQPPTLNPEGISRNISERR